MIISKIILILTKFTKFVKNSGEILFLHFLKKVSKFKVLHDQVWNKNCRDCLEKNINFELSSRSFIKIKELDYLLKNQKFLLDYE